MLKGQGRRKVLGYTGRSEEVRPTAATEGRKMDRTFKNKWAFRFLRTLLTRFDMTDIILPPYEFRINFNQFSHTEDGGSTFLRNYTVQKQPFTSTNAVKPRKIYHTDSYYVLPECHNVQMFVTFLAKYKLYSEGN